VFFRWKPFDPARNVPDLGPRFSAGEKKAYANLRKEKIKAAYLAQQTHLAAKAGGGGAATGADVLEDKTEDDEFREGGGDKTDLDWSTVIKRTFEAYIRGERPNMYGEWLVW
jgi:DDB1- and CUL4-associated factor 13